MTAASGDGFVGWVWEDRAFCDAKDLSHPLSCYFDPPCRRNDSLTKPWHVPRNIHFPQCFHKEAPVNEAGAEILFSRLTPRVLALADAAAEKVFGPEGAPPNLITVHLRWGDKGKEMELLSVDKYIEAVESLALKVHNSHILLSSLIQNASCHRYLCSLHI